MSRAIDLDETIEIKVGGRGGMQSDHTMTVGLWGDILELSTMGLPFNVAIKILDERTRRIAEQFNKPLEVTIGRPVGEKP